MIPMFLRYSVFTVAGLLVFSSCKEGGKAAIETSFPDLPSVALSKANDKAKVKSTKYGWRPYAVTDDKLLWSDYDTILHGVSRKKFDSLENYVSKFDEVYNSGDSKRKVFYDVFREYDSINGASPEKYFDRYTANLTEWRDNGNYPAVADLALANFYICIAWNHRGASFADKVKDAQWEKFDEFIEKADQVLDASVDEIKEDPNYYATKIIIGMAQSKSPKEVEDIFFEGQKRFPDYQDLYLNMNYCLQTKWLGETEKSWYDFLERALDKVALSRRQKDSIYGAVVRENLRGRYDDNDAIDLYNYWGIDVERFLRGLRFNTEKAPGSTLRADIYLYHAVKADNEKAIVEALKLIDGWYHNKRWKGDEWFVLLDSILEKFPKTRPYIRLDEQAAEK